jgi:chorismate mutase
MSIRAIRGATKLFRDDMTEMDDAVSELLLEILDRNQIETDDVISVLFTATPDIHCGFPAAAARKLGWRDIPLICSVEIDVAGALDLVVRVMMQVETDKHRSQISHVYLRGAEVLRLDIAQ